LLLGFPVTFTLSAIGVLYGLVAIELGMMQPALFQALPQRVFGIVEKRYLAGRSVLYSDGAYS